MKKLFSILTASAVVMWTAGAWAQLPSNPFNTTPNNGVFQGVNSGGTQKESVTEAPMYSDGSSGGEAEGRQKHVFHFVWSFPVVSTCGTIYQTKFKLSSNLKTFLRPTLEHQAQKIWHWDDWDIVDGWDGSPRTWLRDVMRPSASYS